MKVSRREFCAGGVISLLNPLDSTGMDFEQEPAQVPAVAGHVGIELLRDLASASLLDLSSDGSKACLCCSQQPLSSYSFDAGVGSYRRTVATDVALSVVDIGGGKEAFRSELPARPITGTFFGDGQRLYVEAPLANGRSVRRMTIDLVSGELIERTGLSSSNEHSREYVALTEDLLLGVEILQNPYLIETLLRAHFPDLAEISRTPYSVSPTRGPGNRDTGLFVSADRGTAAYGVSNYLVVRRTDDLSVLWSSSVDPTFFGVRRISLTPYGRWVGAAVVDTTAAEFQRKYYIAVFEGKSGREVRRLSVNGSEGIALSPDGSLLAVGTRVLLDRDIHLGVKIYNVQSGEIAAGCEHDRVPPGRYQNLLASFDQGGIQFTPDGGRLVTSGNNHVRIWNLRVSDR